LLEAAASGLAIIATDVGGNSQIVKHGETGLLIPSDDQDALTTAIIQLLSDPTLRRTMGLAGAAWIHANATSETMQSAYERLYRVALKLRR
jgi:glycosyltransferase involved in cell wall biosynthesis